MIIFTNKNMEIPITDQMYNNIIKLARLMHSNEDTEIFIEKVFHGLMNPLSSERRDLIKIINLPQDYFEL